MSPKNINPEKRKKGICLDLQTKRADPESGIAIRESKWSAKFVKLPTM